MKKRLCIVLACFLALTCAFALAACEEDGGTHTHTHTFSEQWSYDSEFHWHAATCEHSDEISDKGRHIYDKYEADYSNGNCILCGYDPVAAEYELKLNEDGNGYILTKYKTFGGVVAEIPVSYRQKPIVEIAPLAFAEALALEEVRIPHSVVTIKSAAFAGLPNLKTVNFRKNNGFRAVPSRLETIESYAFQSCEKLTEISLPDSLYTIGESAFEYCTNLIKVSLGKNVDSIENNAFQYCEKLIEVINASDLTIESGSKNYGCIAEFAKNVVNADYGNSMTVKTEDGFYFYCGQNDDVSLMGYCGNSIRLYLPDEITDNNGNVHTSYKIYPKAFLGNKELISIRLPASVSQIGDYAFAGCEKLIEVENLSALDITEDDEIGNGGVAKYAKNVFTSSEGESCISVERPDVVPESDSPDDIARPNIGNLSGYYFFQKGSEHYLVSYVGWDSIIVLPEYHNDSPYDLYAGAFFNQQNLKKISIPDTVSAIGGGAFIFCGNLSEIELPANLTEIASSTFAACLSLKTISLPESVKTIGYQAFLSCTSLNSVVLGNSVEKIGEAAFFNCSSLKRITLPASVSSVATFETFDRCSALEKIEVDENNPFYASQDGILYKHESTGLTIEIIPGALKGAIVIPDGCTSKITREFFSGNKNITSVTIGSGVTEIGSGAFSGCTALTSVTLPDGLTTIGYSAFSGCASLVSIIIPNSVTEIQSGAFSGCAALTTVTLPNSLTKIESSAFESCTALASITLPSGLTSIGESAFMGCSALTEVTIPESVETIETSAFEECTSLETAVINAKNIVGTTFGLCFNLRKIVLGEFTELVDLGAFLGSPLQEITVHENNAKFMAKGNCLIEKNTNALVLGCRTSEIPTDGSVTSIADYAFVACCALRTISIPAGVTSIGESAFNGCAGLLRVILPVGLTEIKRYAFRDCRNIIEVCNLSELTITAGSSDYGEIGLYAKNIYTNQNANDLVETESGYLFMNENGKWTLAGYRGNEEHLVLPDNINGNSYSIGALAFSDGGWDGEPFFNTTIKSVTIPSGVTEIGDDAFYGCNSLSSISIPDSVTSIGSYAFDMCRALAEVHITDLAAWCSIGFATESKSEYGKTDANPLKYAQSLYLNGQKIVTLSLPSGVTSIADYAFYGLTSITSVTFPGGLTRIGYSAFEGCTSLAGITIPNGVTEIGDDAFNGCTALTSVTLPNGLTTIGNSAFWGCASLVSIIIPNSVTEIDGNAFRNCTSLASIALPSGLSSIEYYMFANCTSLTSVSIPGSVTSIQSNAFSGCASLTSIALPSGLTEIGNEAFSGCTSLSSITLPSGLTEIRYSAFYRCISLTSITIPDSVTNLYWGAFSHCTSLESVILGSGISVITESLFKNCTALTSVSIPGSVTSIKSEAFSGCASLIRIQYDGETYEWRRIQKESNWNYHSAIDIINCTNGSVHLD